MSMFIFSYFEADKSEGSRRNFKARIIAPGVREKVAALSGFAGSTANLRFRFDLTFPLEKERFTS
jgi:hypothetical protein